MQLKTKATLISAIAIATITLSAPRADAFSIGGIFDKILGVATGQIGKYIGSAVSQYIGVGLNVLNQKLGINVPGLSSGALGLVSGTQASNLFLSGASSTQINGLELNPLIDGKTSGGLFSVSNGNAIGDGVLSKEGQEAIAENNKAVGDIVKTSGDIASSASGDNVTQNIMKKQVAQTAITNNMLGNIGAKQDVTNTQLAGLNQTQATIAELMIQKEKREQNADLNESNFDSGTNAYGAGILTQQ